MGGDLVDVSTLEDVIAKQVESTSAQAEGLSNVLNSLGVVCV